MTERIRVLVADDHAIVRDGLVTVLGLLPDVEVVGEAADGAQAVEMVARLAPHVVLMDLRMPVLDGAGATARIAAEHPATAVLVLTTYADDASIGDALAAGARGYVTKDAGRLEVAAAIRAVASGQTTLSADVGERLVRGLRPAPARSAERFRDLTPRGAEVLDLLAEGLSNREIAGRLYVSVATVKTHINAIFAKLGVSDRAHAIARVQDEG